MENKQAMWNWYTSQLSAGIVSLIYFGFFDLLFI